MSSYRIGAFEALEWAWHMLRSHRDQPGGVDEARRAIHEVLSNMGKGDEVKFCEKIIEVADSPSRNPSPTASRARMRG